MFNLRVPLRARDDVFLMNTLTDAQLEPQGVRTESLFEDASNTFERNFILRALEKNGWNVTGTAEYLGVPLSTLKYKMDKLDVRQLARRLRGA